MSIKSLCIALIASIMTPGLTASSSAPNEQAKYGLLEVKILAKGIE